MHPDEYEDYFLSFNDSKELMEVLKKSIESGEKNIQMILTGEMEARKKEDIPVINKTKEEFKINKYT